MSEGRRRRATVAILLSSPPALALTQGLGSSVKLDSPSADLQSFGRKERRRQMWPAVTLELEQPVQKGEKRSGGGSRCTRPAFSGRLSPLRSNRRQKRAALRVMRCGAKEAEVEYDNRARRTKNMRWIPRKQLIHLDDPHRFP